MTTIIASDNAIIEINQALNTILSQYLNINGNKIDIRFDLPEINSIQPEPTVSVFLYNIHEDLQLRSAEPRRYNPATRSLLPGWVNINCNYLITYWDANKPSSDSSSPDSQPNNQAAQVMTRVLNALINNRQLTGIPGAYTRVIPQQENLNSLGNFWQALGNRPRLSLLYSITAPMKLQDIKEDITPISQISASVDQKPNLDNSQINQALADKLCTDLGGTEDIRLALAKVNLITEPTTDNNYNQENENVVLEVSGMTLSTYLPKIKDILSTWKNSQSAIIKINGIGIIIVEENADKLIGI
ncbi:DUF4255 domain-containing protein [Photorhabdus laumondii subsp. laumondii]|uniref:Photorhabdus luminescens subsp. laumondii TTO1 complete genome segment 6/17 n=2 Tax=Photorhabdus laumondii subsp. laumondii TaxID=141679 RepID=Q7N6A8_PHOLL|nr:MULTISPECIES: DUF4255 domain-containing protein [Photorhabdus]AWK41497.1 hypothetical protein A4R40_08350 [Photorhabdus laumondii subsp. laumondii]AXG42297.1 DUF4255 domain-containing protein [Photorhabdus laumondii subsp. laumondii]AXG46820.1 DUF4255 domain-containing protein [Photorhabdus laumondii subsp. laumondii]KTL60613.1 hypothetical protein AA106_12170 [Photorhabdus laumondii subsp. laumondii]MCC8382120.1 DUF4255 domain-containing protein [Photorhabdus laumondii]